MKVAIVGGGAAGMMCAATIAELNPHIKVFLFEKNESLGKKVIISGGGRCNVTTGITDVKQLLSKYPRGSKFLTSAMHHFSPSDVYAWFENHGVPLKCEKDNRVFPQSDNGKDIVAAFEKVFASAYTTLLPHSSVREIKKTPTGFAIALKDVPPLQFDAVVLALGGQAYRQTGSTGDGYTLAESLGHHITPLGASLNSFITKEKWPRALAGVSFAAATLQIPGNKKYRADGPFLFTHAGLSGPAVFALSSLIAFETYTPAQPLLLHIDGLPELTEEAVVAEIKKYVIANPKKSFKNSIHAFTPASVAEILCSELHIASEQKSAETSNKELTLAARWLKHVPLHIVGRGAGDEFVTAGGVKLGEVNPTTMESTLCPGLFFAGEILDVDGYTGGFNLQASWATGRAAGQAIAQRG